MKLENQVSSAILSNRLHELGVHRPSRFYREWTGAAEHEIDEWTDPEGDCCLDNVNCYTVAELGEMLPAFVKGTRLQIDKMPNDHWMVGYIPVSEQPDDIGEMADTEADARAKMLIYLIENGMIKP